MMSFLGLGAQDRYHDAKLIISSSEIIKGKFRYYNEKFVIQWLNPELSSEQPQFKRWQAGEFKSFEIKGEIYKSLNFEGKSIILKELLSSGLSLYTNEADTEGHHFYIEENGEVEQLSFPSEPDVNTVSILKKLQSKCIELNDVDILEVQKSNKKDFSNLYDFLIAYNKCEYPKTKIVQRIIPTNKKVWFGLVLGGNTTSVAVKNSFFNFHYFTGAIINNRVSLDFGGFLKFDLTKNLSLTSEVIFVQKKFQFDKSQLHPDLNVSGIATLNYTQLGIGFNYGLTMKSIKPYLLGGFGWQSANKSTKINIEIVDPNKPVISSNAIQLFDADYIVFGGIGLEKPLEKLILEFEGRYIYSRPTAISESYFITNGIQCLVKIGF